MKAIYKDQAVVYPKLVWFSGSTALVEGQGLCYDRDYVTTATDQTATDPWGFRDKIVALPGTTTNMAFAGVATAAHAAVTGGQWIEIYEPKSICNVSTGSDTTINATHLWCGISGAAGRFRTDGGVGLGRGAALALETNASGNLGESLDGSATVATVTVTKTGLFASAAAGDKVIILASSTAAGAAGATAGEYTISSVTSNDVAVLTASAGTGDIACYVISGNPVVMCKLLDGEETGLVEWINMLDNDASASMVGGCTHIMGGVTLDNGDCTHTLADGTATGQKKGFSLHGALTTQDYLITVTSGIRQDGSTGLGSIEMDADGDYAFLEWYQDEWQLMAYGGPTLA